MSKGTTPHYQKKNSAMAEAWARRKREANATNTQHQIFQKMYRQRCLGERVGNGTWTEKNTEEADRVGVRGLGEKI